MLTGISCPTSRSVSLTAVSRALPLAGRVIQQWAELFSAFQWAELTDGSEQQHDNAAKKEVRHSIIVIIFRRRFYFLLIVSSWSADII